MSVRAVIFDVDGVIVDTEPLWSEATIGAAAEFGVTIHGEQDLAKIKSQSMGRGELETSALACSTYQIPASPEIFSAVRRRKLLELLQTKLVARQGAVELIRSLHDNGIICALATSAGRQYLDFIIGRLGLKPFISATVSGDEVERAKPDPDIFLRAAQLVKAPPAECVVIEDSVSGVAAAKVAGMRCVAVLHIHNSRAELHQADRVVAELSDLSVRDLMTP